MQDEAKVLELVELALSTDCSPEEVCESRPELLSEVKRRLRRCRLVDAELNAIFPESLEHAPSSEEIQPAVPGYEIESILGRGGMGIVYKARQVELGRTVALKMLLAGGFASSSQRVRFFREAKAVAGLSHPSIVQIYDYGHCAGRPYYAMEYIDGRNLAEFLEGRQITADEAARYALDISKAMEQAHALGIVHRDLKPANLLLTQEGVLKVTDFGLARKLDDSSRLTLTGDALGTPSYMAPEQAQGKQNSIGPATDIYAIGVTLYEMLTGRPPFHSESPAETLRQLLQEHPVPPTQFNSDIPLDLQTICLKCLEKSPERRYVTCSALSEDLRRLLNGTSIAARPIGRVELVHRWANRNRSMATALSVTALALVIALVGSIVAASYFRKLARENGELAKQKSDLADKSEMERRKTVEAEKKEQQLRRKAESLSDELRRTLYLTEMRLISQTADAPGGMNRLSERLANWELGKSDERGWEWGYLNGLLNQSEAVLAAHAQGVHQLALSPNSDRLLTVGGDLRACIWQADTKELLFRFTGHSAPVTAGAWSHDGDLVATVDQSGFACVWRSDSGELMNRWSASQSSLQAVAWSPDGQMIATAGNDRSVRVWDANSHVRLHELTGHGDRIMTIDWSSTGRLASGSLDKSIRLWELEDKAKVIEFKGHQGWVRDVKWSSDGQRLASVSGDRSAIVWDIPSGSPSLRLNPGSLGIKSVAWSPDGKLLATGGDDQLVRIWSADDGAVQQTLAGHSREVNSISWGKILATGGMDGQVRLWNETRSSKSFRRIQQSVPMRSLKWSPADPHLFVAGGGGGQLLFCAGKEVERCFAGNRTIREIDWNASGEALAVLDLNGKVQIFDLPSRKVMQSFPDEYGDTRAIAWSPDGRSIAAGASDGSLRVFGIADATTTHSLTSQTDPIVDIAWSPDGSQLAVGTSVGYVKLYIADKLQEVRTLREGGFASTDLVWSPDNLHLAIAAQQDSIEIWRVSDGERIALLHGNKSHPAKIAWSPNGSRIATAGRDGSIRVWDFETSREVIVFGEQQSSSHSAVDWSCDGFALAGCDENGEIVVYDAWNGFFAAKSPQLLPTLDERLQKGQDVKDMLSRGLVYARMHEVERASSDFQSYLSRTNQPWIIADCYVAGPYPISVDHPGPPEFEENRNSNPLIPPQESVWQRVPFSDHDFINFSRLFDRKTNISGYVYFPIYCSDERDVTLELGSDDQMKVWLNENLVHQIDHLRSAIPGQDQIRVRLHHGWNRILVRVANAVNNHILCFEIKDGANPAGSSKAPISNPSR